MSVVEDYVVKSAQSVGVEGARTMTAQQALMEVFGKIAKWKLKPDDGGAEDAGNMMLGF